MGYLRENLRICRGEIFKDFPTAIPHARGAWYDRLPHDRKEEAFKVLDFVIKLWLMVDVKRRFVENHGEEIMSVWEMNMSLEGLLHHIFPEEKVPDTESSRWPYNFHAANLHHMGDFKIIWTERLQDHLVIDETNSAITMRIYHHGLVLECLQLSDVGKAFPSGFLEETLQSLAILLPKYNRANQQWMGREQRRAKRNKGTLSQFYHKRKS